MILIAIARAGSRLVAAGEHGVIVYSDDNGTNWAQASVPVDITFTCLAFATPSSGWAAGHYGAIVATSDGGKTWQKQLTGIEANKLTLAAAQLATAQNNTSPAVPLAMMRAQRFINDGPSKPFLSLAVFSPAKVMVFGAYRLTMMTTDGGRNWADWSLHFDDRLSHNLYGAAILGSNVYVVGEAGLVFCSTDGGNSFPQLAAPGDVTLFGVVGAADGGLIVFGVAGNAFRSTNGGKTWTAIPLATQDNLTAGRVLRDGKILLASEAGLLFVSKDNGATFIEATGAPPMAMFDFEEAADGGIVFVGQAGAVRVIANSLNI